MKEFGRALTDGLATGFAGSEIKRAVRGGFAGKASHVLLENGTYHDEWFSGKKSGGGQELVEVDGDEFTRLYGGGVESSEILASLGIGEKEVNRYLIFKIMELGDKTRLFEDCTPKPDGKWQYAYRVTSSDPGIQLTTAMETIDYDETRVHAHAFILSPVK